MPRGRKKTTTPVETPVTTEATMEAPVTSPGHVAPEPVAPPTAATDDSFRAELGASDPTTPVSSSPEATAAASRGRFRSWVVDTARGYTRLTDEREQRILLQFAQKPSADVLTAIKGAGFQFLADYEGLNHVWVRRNDFETRLQVEAIEKLIGTVPSRESVPR